MKNIENIKQLKNAKAALVLSGGGARGIAHISVIQELLRAGIEISSISGTSMGALVGAVYAMGRLEEFRDWILSLDRLNIVNLLDFSFTTQGLIKGDKVLGRMKEIISDKNIEDLPIPYAAVAADLINREEVVFRNGSIYDAIRASIAIPTVFTPVKTKTGLLVDGGIVNNIPVQHVARNEGDMLIVVNVSSNIPATKPQKEDINSNMPVYQRKLKEFQAQLQKLIQPNKDKLGYFELISETMMFMVNHIAQLALQNCKPDLLIELSREECSIYDFFRVEEMLETGRNATLKSIEQYGYNK